MTETKPLGAQISHHLFNHGVTVIFGIPGVHNQEMYRGIEDAGITHVLARHEQGAGFMADGYARASGKPGVCYVITGPGVCNVMTPLGQAYSDSVPVLCVSSCLDETASRRGQLHQMLDQEGAAATVCDWSETARTPQAAYALIDRAMGEFQTKRPRSKHITVPIAALEAQAPAASPVSVQIGAYPVAHVTDLQTLQAHITQAERPLFIFGGGAVAAASDIPALMDGTGAAAFVTYAGRGLVPPDHPAFFGSNLARPSSADVFAQADLVVTFGSELAEGDLWRTELGHSCLHVRVDIDPEVLANTVGPCIGVQADAAEVIAGLVMSLDKPVAAKWDTAAIRAQRDQWRADVDQERPGISAIAACLKSLLPDQTMIFSDMTQFAYTAKEVWDMPAAGHWHHPTGFGTLGYAVPAAIGATQARKGLPTVAIIGDYGFQYTVQELGTAVELGQPLPIILWDNGKLGEIEASMVRAQIAPNAVVAHNPDFLALARAYGAGAAEPKNRSELQSTLKAAFDRQGPTVILMTPAFDPAP